MGGWRERTAMDLGLRGRPEVDPTHRAWILVALISGILVGATDGWAGWFVGLAVAIALGLGVNRYLLGVWRPKGAPEVVRSTGGERWLVFGTRHRLLASLLSALPVAVLGYVVEGALGRGWGVGSLVVRTIPALVVLGPVVWWALGAPTALNMRDRPGAV